MIGRDSAHDVGTNPYNAGGGGDTVLPDARHVSLPYAGHWPQLEDPEGFDGALLDFLASAARVLH